MDIRSYLNYCLERGDTEELALCWHFMGEQVATPTTKAYVKGMLYAVYIPNAKANDSSESITTDSSNDISEDPAGFHNQLFYCEESYLGTIDWAHIKSLDEAQQTTLSSGITANCFQFLNTTIDINMVPFLVKVTEDNNPDYTPFTKYDLLDNKEIIIDDDTYYQIMQVIGQPFIKSRELEYNRQAILKLAIEPALREYYTYFPLIQEQVIPSRAGGDYCIKYPTEPYPAYKAIAWVTSPGLAKNSFNGLSPLAALGTEVSMYTRSAQGSRFAQGLRYNKPVPGFTGESGGSAYKEMATAWPLANTLKNMNRREKLSKVHKEDGTYAIGYSTLSGYLNIRWLCWSRNFDDVEFEDWPKVIQLCQAHVKFSIGAIRDLLNTDSNIPFRGGIQKEGHDEMKAILDEWAASPITKIYTPSRGGLL